MTSSPAPEATQATAVTQAPEATAFDPERAWELDPQVSLRPEPFGALAYHFGNRRLSFLTSPLLLSVVEALADQPSARDACLAAGVPASELDRYEHALATLADRGMIRQGSDR